MKRDVTAARHDDELSERGSIGAVRQLAAQVAKKTLNAEAIESLAGIGTLDITASNPKWFRVRLSRILAEYFEARWSVDLETRPSVTVEAIRRVCKDARKHLAIIEGMAPDVWPQLRAHGFDAGKLLPWILCQMPIGQTLGEKAKHAASLLGGRKPSLDGKHVLIETLKSLADAAEKVDKSGDLQDIGGPPREFARNHAIERLSDLYLSTLAWSSHHTDDPESDLNTCAGWLNVVKASRPRFIQQTLNLLGVEVPIQTVRDVLSRQVDKRIQAGQVKRNPQHFFKNRHHIAKKPMGR